MTATHVFTCAQHALADAESARSGVPLNVLMARAGAGVARLALAHPCVRAGGGVLVLAGPGGNGGDGAVAARQLARLWPSGLGTPAARVRLGALAGAKGDPVPGSTAAAARAEWVALGGAPLRGDALGAALAQTLESGGLVIDALFGAGLSRPLEGEAAELAARLGAAPSQVLAVDTPSGLPGDAQSAGGYLERAARADQTVTFLALKPAHLLAPFAQACGKVTLLDIGHSHQAVAAARAASAPLQLNAPEVWAREFPWPDPLIHKHRRGRLGVLVGPSVHTTGAGRLAARAGLRAGAGLATLLCPPSALLAASLGSTAVMTRPLREEGALMEAGGEMHAIVVGPAGGVGAALRAQVAALLGCKSRLVLDADALTSFSAQAGGAPDTLFEALRPGDVLTPHEGEFARLFPDLARASESGRVEAVRAAAKRAGCVVLLKGPSTVIAEPGGRALINVHASPHLATAGSGDVLAGVIGGLLAQGMGTLAAAGAGAWLHGEAGRALGPGLIAEDLCEQLPMALGALYDRMHQA